MQLTKRMAGICPLVDETFPVAIVLMLHTPPPILSAATDFRQWNRRMAPFLFPPTLPSAWCDELLVPGASGPSLVHKRCRLFFFLVLLLSFSPKALCS